MFCKFCSLNVWGETTRKDTGIPNVSNLTLFGRNETLYSLNAFFVLAARKSNKRRSKSSHPGCKNLHFIKQDIAKKKMKIKDRKINPLS